MATKSSKAEAQSIREFIIENVTSYPDGITKHVSEKFGITRQASHRYVKALVSEGILISEGNTRNTRYDLKPTANAIIKLKIDKNLKEDTVWRERVMPLIKNVPDNVVRICEYGFTEILNNAADHSGGKTVRIVVAITKSLFKMTIGDDGIGIFKKIQDQFKLDDPKVAVLELVKGKLTTDPKRHTGEGIFFASRSFDKFIIQSDKLFFSHTEPDDDWVRDDQEQLKGTSVTMQISLRSKRTTKSVFDKYASHDQDYAFSTTQVPVALARIGQENLVSRSQAKRLLARFEKFSEVFLDFKGVETIGQAFADEVFRVFAVEHPKVKFQWINANTDIEKMIHRAKGAA